MAMKNAVFWDEMPYGSLKSHTASHPRRRHSSSELHHQNYWVSGLYPSSGLFFLDLSFSQNGIYIYRK
jgi:hypothetical protein